MDAKYQQRIADLEAHVAFPFNGRKHSAEGTLSVADALRAFSTAPSPPPP